MFWSSVVLKIYFKTKQKGIRICKWNKTDLYSGLPSVCASYKEPACQCRRCRRPAFDPGSGRSPQGGHGNPLQYSCLENPRDGGAWWAAVYGVTQSWTQLQQLSSSSSSSNSTVQVALVVKNPPANAGGIRDGGLIPGLVRSPWRRAWQPSPVFLSGESHGQRTLVGYIVHGSQKSWISLSS